MIIPIELKRTNPDYVVYCPDSTNRATKATGNEHLLVTELVSGDFLAIWTQSSYEGESDQHIMSARSLDCGHTWGEPVNIAGPDSSRGIGMASWAFPIVAKTGRVYVFFSRHVGINDIFTHTTGVFMCIVSDDEGRTWSDATRIQLPRSIWDNPDPSVPSNCIVWQKPIQISDGRYIAGVTRWVSPKASSAYEGASWWAMPAVVDFLRFENIDVGPAVSDLVITVLSGDSDALRVPVRTLNPPGADDTRSVVQEPSIVELPDGRLFCVLRTTLGSPYYSVSSDCGATWTKPDILRYYDGGPALLHPLSPCPIYPLHGTSDYVLLYHNHDGNFMKWTPDDTSHHRRPICLTRGAYRPTAHQPIWFSEPWYFMDNGGIPILRNDLAMYASTTPLADGSGITLWYPERKFFLLGKIISAALVQSLSVPEAEPEATTV